MGIGTASPSQKLEVVGTGTFQGLRILSGASNGFVLTSDAVGNARWAAAAGGGNNWSLSGNAIGANDFIGTTNNQDLILKRNNVIVANFSTGGNLALGESALVSNTTGNFNVAIGIDALFSNTTGNFNTANGVYALFSNITGTGNVALGYESLRFATGSSFQTAIGYQALRSNTS